MSEFEAFLELHSGLPRQGPGSEASALRALSYLPDGIEARWVADIGCGPGAGSIILARELAATIIAVDLFPAYLAELSGNAAAAGMTHRIHPVCADMVRLPFPDAAFDVIWSEGAVYFLGWEAGLAQFHRYLRPGGFLLATELTWLTDAPPEPAAGYFASAYPAMQDIAANCAAAKAAGYRFVGDFTLPSGDWWTDYYTPLAARADRLEAGADGDMRAAIAATREEIDMYRAHGGHYGYVFYILQRPD